MAMQLPSYEKRAAVTVDELQGAFGRGWFVVTAPRDLATMRVVVAHHAPGYDSRRYNPVANHYRDADPVGCVWWLSDDVLRRVARDLPALADALAATTEAPIAPRWPPVWTFDDAG